MKNAIIDGLANVVTNLGTRNDKAAHSTYHFTYVNHHEVEAAFQTSSWFRKIVTIPVDDSIRNGVDFKANKDQIEQLEDELKRLQFWKKFRRARIMARRDGGAAIVMGLPGDPETPVNPETIKKGDLTAITVLSRFQINPIEPIQAVLDENFGQPGMYQLSVADAGSIGQRIHPSRVLRFIGNECSENFSWSGWGESIYPPMRQAIINCDTTTSAIAHMMNEANVDILAIPNLTELLSTQQYEDRLMKRVTVMSMFKSLTNMTLLDSGDGADNPAETLDRKTYTFAGLADILAAQMGVLAGVCDIPATRLLGKSPDGMNATGDGDLRNYYDNITAQQKLELSPIVDPFFDFLIRSTFGTRDPSIWYKWSPLYTLSEKESAEIEKIYAEVITAYVNSGIVRTEILSKIAMNGMIERGQFPGLEDAMDEFDPEEIPALDEPTEEDIAFVEQPALPAPRVAANDAVPKSLYIHRKVVNSDDIIRWAKSQGLDTSITGMDLHVTVVYSRDAIDWMKTGESWASELKIPAGGPRLVERFNEGSIVLSFASNELSWRHRSIVDMGASHDWPDYQPHITVAFNSDPDFDIDAIEPYQGEIVLGPELFSELRSM